jgi:type II secretory pathway pseudopilin PulG
MPNLRAASPGKVSKDGFNPGLRRLARPLLISTTAQPKKPVCLATDMKLFNLKSKTRTRRSAAAFSLVEQLVGVAVVGVSITALYGALSQGFAIIQIARENLRATQVLCERTETIRLYTLEQVTNVLDTGTNFMPRTFVARFFPVGQTNIGVTYQGTVTVQEAPLTNVAIIPNYNTNLIQLNFEVTWTSADVTRRRSMGALVARNGVQSYIY